MASKILKIHDKIFSQLAHEHDFIKEIVKKHLPPQLSHSIQWDTFTFERLDTQHIDSTLKKSTHSDTFFKAQIGKELGFFCFHIEHQSTPDPLMALRLTNYQTGLLLNYAKRYKLKKVPLLFSFVYYHGKTTPYPYSMNGYDCFESAHSEEIRRLASHPILIDLSEESDEQIMKDYPKSSGVQLTFKHILSLDFSKQQESILQALQATPSAMRLIALQYIILRANVDKESLMANIQIYLPSYEEKAMELYQINQQRYMNEGLKKGIEQGIEQGMQQGRFETQQRIALELLKQGDLIEKITQVTGLSKSELEVLSRTMR